MNKKSAVELSMNFMVVLILGIIILSMGIYLSYRALNRSYEVSEGLDTQIEQQIYNLLDDGGIVVAPVNSADIMRGAKPYVFGIGVRNINYSSNFKVFVEGVQVMGDKGVMCDSSDLKNIQFLMTRDPSTYYFATAPKYILENDEAPFSVIVEVPKSSQPCQYVVNAWVAMCPDYYDKCDPLTDPAWMYGTMQKLYINVK